METTNNLHEVNGNHYECLKYEPVTLFQVFNLNWFQAEPIKYISRFWNKHGITDLKKAKHIMSMAEDMGITIPINLTIDEKLLSAYCYQFHVYFNASHDPSINQEYFMLYVRLITKIIFANWVEAMEVLDRIVYYFYGKEEQEYASETN